MRDETTVKNPFTLSLFLQNKIEKNGRYFYIMYRISHRGRRSLITSGYSIEPIHWDKVKGKVNTKHPNHKLINGDLSQTIGKVEELIAKATANGRGLTIDEVRLFFGKGPTNQSQAVGFIGFLNELVDQLEMEGRLGNAKAYAYARNSFSKFMQGKDLTFERFDYTLLRKYETELRKRNMKETSISLHFRTLRAVYNEAMRRKLVDKTYYPFNEFKVSKFSTDTNPRAIPKASIKAIEALELSRESFLYDARNYFLFCYYGCGINFVDLAQLRWTDLEGEVITYNRQKTGKVIKFQVTKILRSILDWYEVFTGRHPESYIFPILDHTKHITLKQIDNRIDKVDKRVNKALRELSAQAGLINKVTFYTARHTFANELQLAGVPVSRIASLLGDEERVVKTYLEKLSDSDKFSVLHHLD